MRKRSSKARRHRHHVKVLKSEVMSPRIAWFNFLSFLQGFIKVALMLGLLAAIAYGIREAIEHTFHRNPDFRLQAITLTPNDVLDEGELVTMLDIDLSANIFDFDTGELERKLMQMPAIASAKVERNLPGTLDFQISTRKPVAWIACPEEGIPAKRTADSMLVDEHGTPYPCPPGQAEVSQNLPILLLSRIPEHPILRGKTMEHPEYMHCLKLLKAVVARYPEELQLVDTISQANKWSLAMKTRSGTVATFGLGEHERQLEYLGRAFDHSREKGYSIATINLIPKRNVPITLSGEDAPPRAIPVREENTPEEQRNQDLHNLLNRN